MIPITYKDYERLVIEKGGTSWETGKPLPDVPLVFTTSEHLDNLFRDILEDEHYDNNFTLVSGASDSGVYYQSDINPIADIRNWVQMDPFLDERLGQHDYICRSRHEKSRCLARDKFALKMYSWTAATFPKIPKCVTRWHTTNCQIKEDKVTAIPFGINPDALKSIKELISYKPKERSNKVVACWSNTTNQRMYIKNSLDRANFYTDECSQDEFFQRLITSKYCLCPEGNGLDSYRILEAIYLGCLPIIVTNLANPIWQRCYGGLPTVRPNEIGNCLSNLISSGITLENFMIPSSLSLEYWESLL